MLMVDVVVAEVESELGCGSWCARRARAFIDDYSRALVGYRWRTAEDVLRLEAALRSGLSARGVPDGILVDRGSAFVSHQLLRACAVLGVKLIHASPRAATTKGKIERFFRTVRGQFLVELAQREVADLAELNGLFAAWVESVYHRRAHTETGQEPLARFMAAGPPALPEPGLLREEFLWQETRTVTREADDRLPAIDQESLEGPGHVPDVLEHPRPLAVELARPLQQLTEPLALGSDRALRDLHPEPVNRNPRVRLLVRIDPDRHHYVRPFFDNPMRRTLGGHYSVGAVHGSYQVTPGRP